MRGIISRTTIHNITHAFLYPLPAKQVIKEAIPVIGTFPVAHFGVTTFASAGNKQAPSLPYTLSNTLYSTRIFFITHHFLPLGKKDSCNYIINTSGINLNAASKGILNIFKINFRYLAARDKNHGKISSNYYSMQSKNDAPCMAIDRIAQPHTPTKTFPGKHVYCTTHLFQNHHQTCIQLPVKSGTATCTHSPSKIRKQFGRQPAINLFWQAAQTSFKESINYYTAEKPTIIHAPEPSSSLRNYSLAFTFYPTKMFENTLSHEND